MKTEGCCITPKQIKQTKMFPDHGMMFAFPIHYTNALPGQKMCGILVANATMFSHFLS